MMGHGSLGFSVRFGSCRECCAQSWSAPCSWVCLSKPLSVLVVGTVGNSGHTASSSQEMAHFISPYLRIFTSARVRVFCSQP